MPTIYPTHQCFDDAVEYLEMRVQREPALARQRTLVLVHGIALFPDGQPRAGEPFAHAWVEEGGECLFAGMLAGRRVLVAQAREAFYQRLRVQRSTTYTIRQLYRENLRHGHCGPWEPAYLSLCRAEAAS